MKRKPKILLFDIETSLMNLEVERFDLKGVDYFSFKEIKDDWNILSAAWKFLGSDKISSVSLLDDMAAYKKNPRDDKHVVKELAKVISNCDIVIAHNGDAFDIKKLNARLIYHKLPPIDAPYQIDTLKQAKKIAKFTSNRLDYLARHLGYEGKMESEGLWKTINKGGPEALTALRKMVKYNKQDVKILEHVYLALRPYMKGHPNLNMFDKEKYVCGNCGSSSIIKNGFRPTLSGLKQKMVCKECGHITLFKAEK